MVVHCTIPNSRIDYYEGHKDDSTHPETLKSLFSFFFIVLLNKTKKELIFFLFLLLICATYVIYNYKSVKQSEQQKGCVVLSHIVVLMKMESQKFVPNREFLF